MGGEIGIPIEAAGAATGAAAAGVAAGGAVSAVEAASAAAAAASVPLEVAGSVAGAPSAIAESLEPAAAAVGKSPGLTEQVDILDAKPPERTSINDALVDAGSQDKNKDLGEDQDSRIPDRVLGDKGFIEIRDQLHTQAEQSGKVDAAQINKEALAKYYGQWAEARMAEGLPPEITKDSRYGELLQEETNLASAKLGNGEPLDMTGIQKNALAKYKQEQDLAAEAQETQGQEIGEAGARMKALEARLKNMVIENQQLKAQVGELTLAVSELLPMLRDLAKNQQEMIKDPKKKESLLEMLVMLAKIAALSVFKEVEEEAKDVVNDKAA